MKTAFTRFLFIISLSFIISFAFAQPGTLDSSFGVNGKIIVNFNVPEGSYAQSIAIQLDQKIVVAGFTGSKFTYTSDFAVTRHLQNGSPDSSFGINGKVITHFNNARSSYAICVKIQTDGKILIGGAVFIAAHNRNFGLIRYKADGTIDSSFGINGQITTAFGSLNDEVLDIGIQEDGKIIAAGSANGYPAMACYKSNGMLDSAFGTNGLIQDFQGGATYSIETLPGGQFLTAGNYLNINNSSKDFCIKRYNSNGTLDATFGNSGKAFVDFFNATDIPTCLAILNNGDIIAAGRVYVNESLGQVLTGITKIKSNGIPDSSFGVNSKITSDIGQNSYYSTNTVLIQNDQKFIVVAPLNDMNYAIGRFNINGSVDSSFGLNGITTITTGPVETFETFNSAALQADSKIVIVGQGNLVFNIFRLNHDLPVIEPVIVSLKKNISITEGNTGNTPAIFQVVLNKPAPTDVFVNCTTKDLNAVAGSDYIAVSGTVKIKAGKTKANIPVNVIGDNTKEKNEKFALVISNPVNAILGAVDSVVCTIKNDDPSFAFAAVDAENISVNSRIKIYPNPVKDVLKIEGLPGNKKVAISITDISGVTIFSGSTSNKSLGYNVSKLSSGLYYVRIENGTFIEILKFIKE